MTPERAEQLLRQALSRSGGTHTLEDVAKEALAGNLYVETGEDCIGVFEIVNYPCGKWLNIFLAAGDGKEIKSLQASIEAKARAFGCTHLMFYGRPPRRSPWTRWLSASGFRPAWTCFVKELT